MLRRLALRCSATPSLSLSFSLSSLLRSPPGGLTSSADGTPRAPPPTRSSARGFLDIHKLADKEAIEKENERLKDEINRGYFADIKEFNAHSGKVAMANKTIISSVAAVKFPELEVYFPDGKSMKLPLDPSFGRSNGTSVSLICLSFRANSQAMIESWSIPFSNSFNNSGNVQTYEVSFIESWVLSLRPVKQLMLRVMKKSGNPLRQTVYAFGDHYVLRKKLNIVNLLTGYPFLLDSYGRIRWQGFGVATEEELSSLIQSTQLLLNEK